MADPERVVLPPTPAFGPGAAHLRATAPAASQPRPRSFGGFGPPIADREGVQHGSGFGQPDPNGASSSTPLHNSTYDQASWHRAPPCTASCCAHARAPSTRAARARGIGRCRLAARASRVVAGEGVVGVTCVYMHGVHVRACHTRTSASARCRAPPQRGALPSARSRGGGGGGARSASLALPPSVRSSRARRLAASPPPSLTRAPPVCWRPGHAE